MTRLPESDVISTRQVDAGLTSPPTSSQVLVPRLLNSLNLAGAEAVAAAIIDPGPRCCEAVEVDPCGRSIGSRYACKSV